MKNVFLNFFSFKKLSSLRSLLITEVLTARLKQTKKLKKK